MPIEFNCSGCSTLIRVPDDAAGQSAKCPSCGSLSDVPSPGATPYAASPYAAPPMPPNGTSPEANVANPFQSPSGTAATLPPGQTFTPAAGGYSVGDQLPPADRGSRLVAVLLDGVITVFPTIAIVMVGAVIAAAMEGDDIGGVIAAICMFVGVVCGLGIAIYNMVLTSYYGETIGKRMMSIRVIKDVDGTPPGFVQGILLRSWVMAILAQVPFVGLIDALMIFGEKRQCLHDLIASTRVVDGKYS